MPRVHSSLECPPSGARQSSRLKRMQSVTEEAAAAETVGASAGEASPAAPPDAAAPLQGAAHPPGLPSRRHTVSNSSRKWKDAVGGAGNGTSGALGRVAALGRRSLDETHSAASSSMSDLDAVSQPLSGSGSTQQPPGPLRPKTPFEVLTQPPAPPAVGSHPPPCSPSTSLSGPLPTVISGDSPLQQRLAAVGLHLPLFDSASRPATSGSSSSGFWLFGGRKNSQNQVQNSQDSGSSTQSPGADLAQRQPSQVAAAQSTPPAAAAGSDKPSPPLPPPPEPSVGVRSRMLQSSECLASAGCT